MSRILQFHQVSSKSDEKTKIFINSPFVCSEFQSVSRIVKIVHSATVLLEFVTKIAFAHFHLDYINQKKIHISFHAEKNTIIKMYIKNNYFLC